MSIMQTEENETLQHMSQPLLLQLPNDILFEIVSYISSPETVAALLCSSKILLTLKQVLHACAVLCCINILYISRAIQH